MEMSLLSRRTSNTINRGNPTLNPPAAEADRIANASTILTSSRFISTDNNYFSFHGLLSV